ncbi:MAG: hypothetical protein ABFS24_11685 [Pseudomonadota bacterium]
MNDTTTQKHHTIGDPNRYVLDSQGNVEWYDTITLCLERADGVIDLAVGYSRDVEKLNIRSHTMPVILQSIQKELDDIRHVLHQWHDAGLPEERVGSE